jgi:hypothetical protein
MSEGPNCQQCIHLAGRLTCARPVESHWNAATRQRRSRLNVDAGIERSSQRSLLRKRRCGPEGLFFEQRFPAEDVAKPHEHDTVGDSDGDDGA